MPNRQETDIDSTPFRHLKLLKYSTAGGGCWSRHYHQ